MTHRPALRKALLFFGAIIIASGCGGTTDAIPESVTAGLEADAPTPTAEAIETSVPATTAPIPDEPDCGAADTTTIASPAGAFVSLDTDASQLPAGIAFDGSGAMYVSLAPRGELIKFTPGSTAFEVFGTIPGWSPAEFGPGGPGAGLLGLAIDRDGHIYAATQWEGSSGVWKFDGVTGAATQLPGSESIGWANSLAFDDSGTLYVSDSHSGMEEDVPLGAIWRIPADGTVEKWLESSLLGGTGELGFGDPLGVNGIVLADGAIQAVVSERSTIVSIPILDSGAPGDIATIVEDAEVFLGDGIALDADGGLYVAVPGQSAVKRVNPDGSIETIAAGLDAGLDLPASVAFGTSEGTRSTLFVTNLALIPEFGTGVGPGVAAVTVGATGLPLN